MPGNCSIFRSWNTGETLTASDLTTSFTTVGVTNMTQTCIDDYAVDTNQFRSNTDPYPSGVASLPTSGAGELERIRYVFKKLTGWTHWYTHSESFSRVLGTITADAQVLGGTVTWDNAGVTFTGIKLNVTDTNSAAASKLLDLQVGGTSKLAVRKDGYLLNNTTVLLGLNTGNSRVELSPANSLQVTASAGVFIVGSPATATGANNGDILMPKNNWLKQPNKDSNGQMRLIGAAGGGASDLMFLAPDGQQTRLGDATSPTAQFEVKSASASRIASTFDTAASPTASIVRFLENGGNRFIFDPHNGTTGAPMTMSDMDTGSGQHGRFVSIGRNTNGTNTGAGFVQVLNKSGTSYNIWVDSAGILRFGTSTPTHANDTSGTAVGGAATVTVLDRVTTNAQVTNTTTETTVYTFSVPGNTLSTNKRLRLHLLGNYFNSTGSNQTLTVRLKYGATTLVTQAVDVDLANPAEGAKIEALLNGDGGTAAQVGSVETFLSNVANQAAFAGRPHRYTDGTSAIDSTGSANLVITVQLSTASVGLTYNMLHAVLELL